MRRGALPRVIAVCALGAVGLGGFETVAHGDLLPPLPTTTVTVPPTLPPLPTSTTVPLPPVTTVTVRLPTTTTVPVPTTTVRLPTPTTTVRLPTTIAPLPTTTAPVRLPSTTTSAVTSTAARGAAAPLAAGNGQPPSPPGAAPNGPAATRKAGARPISGPALEAVKAGAKPVRPTAHARARAGKTFPVLRAARVSARTPGLAAFYAGLEKALANDTTSVVDGSTTPQFVWPAAAADGGVLSRNGALALAIALFALALLLAFSLLPRLAAIGFLPVSQTTAQAARESSLVSLGAITVCALLAILLLRIAL